MRNENLHEGKSEQAEGVEQREPSYIQHSAAFRSLAERTVGQGEKGNLAQLAFCKRGIPDPAGEKMKSRTKSRGRPPKKRRGSKRGRKRKAVNCASAAKDKGVNRDNTLANWVVEMASRKTTVPRGNTLANWVRDAS